MIVTNTINLINILPSHGTRAESLIAYLRTFFICVDYLSITRVISKGTQEHGRREEIGH